MWRKIIELICKCLWVFRRRPIILNKYQQVLVQIEILHMLYFEKFTLLNLGLADINLGW